MSIKSASFYFPNINKTVPQNICPGGGNAFRIIPGSVEKRLGSYISSGFTGPDASQATAFSGNNDRVMPNVWGRYPILVSIKRKDGNQDTFFVSGPETFKIQGGFLGIQVLLHNSQNQCGLWTITWTTDPGDVIIAGNNTSANFPVRYQQPAQILAGADPAAVAGDLYGFGTLAASAETGQDLVNGGWVPLARAKGYRYFISTGAAATTITGGTAEYWTTSPGYFYESVLPARSLTSYDLTGSNSSVVVLPDETVRVPDGYVYLRVRGITTAGSVITTVSIWCTVAYTLN